MYKRTVREDLTQMVITMMGANVVIKDLQTGGKHYFQGHAMLTYESGLPSIDREVPLPNTEVVDSLWNKIFCPEPRTFQPQPLDTSCPRALDPKTDVPMTQVIKEFVSPLDLAGAGNRYSPDILQAHATPANEVVVGKGT